MQKSKQSQQVTDPNQLLSELATHALLHLYFRMLPNEPRSFTSAEKNDILHKWLKPKIKSNRYRSIKKSLKAMLSQAKSSHSDLDTLLERCVGATADSTPPHLDNYLLLISEIEKKLGTTVLLSKPEEVDLKHDENGCLLCVLTQDLNAHFSANNALISPISMLFRGTLSQRHAFLGCIYSSELFNYKVQYQDEQFVRILLELDQ